MKLAILTPTFSRFSGIDRLIEQKLEDYKKKGDEVAILCFESDITTTLAKVIVLGMPKNPTLQRLYRLFFFFARCKIKKAVKLLEGFDVVVAHQYPMTLIAAAAKKRYGIKYVYHDAGIAPPELFRNMIERIYIRLFSFFSYRSIRNADELVFISDFLRQEMLKKNSRTGSVEYVTIDKKRFNKGVDGSAVKKKFSLAYPALLYVGRISPHKNVHGLIAAFKLVKGHFPAAKLLIVGKQTFPSYIEELKKIADGDVIFTGFVPDEELPQYYAAADLYVTASLWEGFDIPAVEAQACGKKVVAFDIGSHKEVIKKGILVKGLAEKALADAIIKSLA